MPSSAAVGGPPTAPKKMSEEMRTQIEGDFKKVNAMVLDGIKAGTGKPVPEPKDKDKYSLLGNINADGGSELQPTHQYRVIHGEVFVQTVADNSWQTFGPLNGKSEITQPPATAQKAAPNATVDLFG